MKSSNYPVLDLERSFPPKILRQLPSHALLVPRLMQTMGGKGTLYKRNNGRGESYYELRLSQDRSKGRLKPYNHYIGPLAPEQEKLLRILVDEYNDQRPPDSIEKLHLNQLMMDQLEQLRLDAKEIAAACAEATGYRLHGYLIKKQSDCDTSNPLDLGRDSAIKIIESWALPLMANLTTVRKQAFDDPEQSLVDALIILNVICDREVFVIDMTLRRSALDRIAEIAIHESCRPLSKIEDRMLARREKVIGIFKKVEKGLKRVDHLDRRAKVPA